MRHHKIGLCEPSRLFLSARLLSGALIVAASLGCGGGVVQGPDRRPATDARTADAISADELAAHTRALSDDRMLGRAPGEEGEAATLEYLVAAYEDIGLVPMGDASLPGSAPESPRFLQRVDLVGIRADTETASLEFSGPSGAPPVDLQHGNDFVTWTAVPEKAVDISGGVVFAGYGIDAPEEGWNDFGNLDVTGKILLVLVGEPPVEDPARFGGEEMSYYGRWTYKIEEGARRGAAAVVLVHDPRTAGYGWNVIKGWTGEALQKLELSTLPPRTPLQGWITREAAARLLHAAGLDLDQLAADAAREAFTAVDLGITGVGHLDTTVRSVTSYNVVGAVQGSDPERADEYIIFVAHWDHLGVGEEVDGDAIYNGAVDNAIGTAALLEIAGAWASMEPAPRRSALFIATTAEESGFLGVVSYIENPVVPLARTLAAINIDGVNVFGPTDDVSIVGMGLTTLEDNLAAVLAARGRHLSPDPEPEQGNFFRSDHFPFALAGIPALCVRPGMSFVDKPDGFGREVWADYYSTRYHEPSDEFDEAWDFGAAAQDVEVMFQVALRVSTAEAWPEWKPGNTFAATRDAMLQSDSP